MAARPNTLFQPNATASEGANLILDARYEKVRHGGPVVDCAVLIAIGVTREQVARVPVGVAVVEHGKGGRSESEVLRGVVRREEDALPRRVLRERQRDRKSVV